MGVKSYTVALHLKLAIIENTLGNYENALQHLQETLFWAERLNMEREFHEAQALLEELQARPKQPEKSEDTGSA